MKRTSRKKQKPTTPARSQQRVDLQQKALNPIPFVPAKKLDFDRHEDLLKRLGLWDFAHIQFDRIVRADLVSQLIVNFNPGQRCSHVNDVRIKLNRADFVRAMLLPLPVKSKKKKQPPAEEEEEAVAFMEDFVSNWMLLHEDTWMMPTEVMEWIEAIKEGQFWKVEWGSLIWFMVDKELAKSPKLGNCYYASHLQYLIKSQKEDLFLVKEQEGGGKVEIDLVDDEEEEEDDYVKQHCVDREPENVEEQVDVVQQGVEKADLVQTSVGKVEGDQVSSDKADADQQVGLGEEQVHVMDIDDFKVQEPTQCQLAANDSESQPCLQLCGLGEVKDLGYGDQRTKNMEFGQGVGDDEEQQGEEQDEHVEQEAEADDDDDQNGDFQLLPKAFSLEGYSSASLIQGMEGSQIPLSSGVPLGDHFSTEFPSSSNLMPPGSSSLFGNGVKRNRHELDNSHRGPSGNKRLRSDGPWNSRISGDFQMVMEPLHQWYKSMPLQNLNQLMMMYESKAQECEQAKQECEKAKMNQQYFLEELQKAKETLQTESYRFENVIQSVLGDYRRATQNIFEDYKARFRQTVEPLYRDVPGSGGLVLSIGELERLNQQLEDRVNLLVIERNVESLKLGGLANLKHTTRLSN